MVRLWGLRTLGGACIGGERDRKTRKEKDSSGGTFVGGHRKGSGPLKGLDDRNHRRDLRRRRRWKGRRREAELRYKLGGSGSRRFRRGGLTRRGN